MTRNAERKTQLLLWDTTAGGAGHVFALAQAGRPWLERARSMLFVDDAHDRTCLTACLRCVLDFDVQREVAKGRISRPAGLALLDQLLSRS